VTELKADNGGLRYNEGKPQWDLMPYDALGQLAMVYTRGAQKYAPHNWLRGMDWSKCFASMQRHAAAWHGGEDNDPETGLPHTAMIAWNALALLTYQLRGLGVDDRVKIEKGETSE
jgi:hypothetical protein